MLLNNQMRKMLENPLEEEKKEDEVLEKFIGCENLPEKMYQVMLELQPKVKDSAFQVQEGWQQIGALQRQEHKLKEYCHNSILKHAKEIEAKMFSDRTASNKRKEIVASNVFEVNKKLERMRDENLKLEKQMRNKRNEVAEKLASIIEQYKTDMKKKESTLTKLLNSYQKEAAALKQLTEVYEKQEARHDQLMKEKTDYERAIWEAKLYEIQKKIAARKIQRFYRSYLAFMMAHGKRGKKGRGKRRK